MLLSHGEGFTAGWSGQPAAAGTEVKDWSVSSFPQTHQLQQEPQSGQDTSGQAQEGEWPRPCPCKTGPGLTEVKLKETCSLTGQRAGDDRQLDSKGEEAETQETKPGPVS